MTRYEHPEAGEWVQPVRRGYRMACCDCGLVHRLNFRLISNKRGHFIQFQVFRHERATGQVRRHMGVYRDYPRSQRVNHEGR